MPHLILSLRLQDAFIGFGGNQVRDKVRREADWFVTDFQDLTNELNRN
jgi:phosphoserine phosphatase